MNATDESDKGSIGEVESVCAEIVAELRGMRDMLALYRQTVADAARYIAHRLADGLILPATDPHGHELAAALGRIGGVSGEVDALLAVPATALRAAVTRQPGRQSSVAPAPRLPASPPMDWRCRAASR
ncbi:MAG: hypothetical protein ACRD0K_29800 [Egibacteraceae bacterium]